MNIKEIVKNVLWLVLDKALVIFIGVFVGMWMIKYFGPVNYGIWVYANTIVEIGVAFSSLGMSAILIKEFIKKDYSDETILGTAFVLKFTAMTITSMIILVGIRYINGDILIYKLVTLLLLASMFRNIDVIDSFYQAKLASRNTVIARNISLLGISLIRLYAINKEVEFEKFAYFSLFESIFFMIIFIYIYGVDKISIWSFDRKIAIKILRESFPLLLAYVSYILYSRIDIFMIKNFMNLYNVGVYAASSKLIEMILSFLIILVQSLYPELIKLYNNNTDEYFNKYDKITKFITKIGFLILLFNAIFSDEIIELLYGDKYKEAGFLLFLQSFSLLFMFNAALRSSHLNIISRQDIIFKTTTIAMFVNVLLNYWLIPIYGIIGAATSNIVTQAISLLLFNIYYNDTREIYYIQFNALTLNLFKKTRNIWREN